MVGLDQAMDREKRFSLLPEPRGARCTKEMLQRRICSEVRRLIAESDNIRLRGLGTDIKFTLDTDEFPVMSTDTPSRVYTFPSTTTGSIYFDGIVTGVWGAYTSFAQNPLFLDVLYKGVMDVREKVSGGMGAMLIAYFGGSHYSAYISQVGIGIRYDQEHETVRGIVHIGAGGSDISPMESQQTCDERSKFILPNVEVFLEKDGKEQQLLEADRNFTPAITEFLY